MQQSRDNSKKLLNINKVLKVLNLEKSNKKKIASHTLRFWEKKFKNINPIKINGRRYYSIKDLEELKYIYYLLRDKKMTIEGAINIINKKINKLDENNELSINAELIKYRLRKKTNKILEKIKKLKK
tara:strand:+ start:4910 stop:5290 length:381 start_codon:yes stop_codon:yes gene_type:complete